MATVHDVHTAVQQLVYCTRLFLVSKGHVLNSVVQWKPLKLSTMLGSKRHKLNLVKATCVDAPMCVAVPAMLPCMYGFQLFTDLE